MRVAVIGAGPAGLLLAHFLNHRETAYQVDMFERRSDIRKLTPSDARTFPIGLMWPGIGALEKVPGLLEEVEKRSVVVDGSCIHRGIKVTAFKRNPTLTIDRNVLVSLLLDKLEGGSGKTRQSPVTVHFDSNVSTVDFSRKRIHVTSTEGKETIAEYDYLVACDGSRSVIRRLLADEGLLSYTETLTHQSYKTVYLGTKARGYQPLQEGKAHGWMVGDYTIGGFILQPDVLTGVLLFPAGNDPTKDFREPSEVYNFLQSNELSEIRTLLSEAEANALIARPASTFVSIKTDRMHSGDSILLIGDAAHSMSASMGQGCNSDLEDVKIFCDCLDEHCEKWSDALPSFTRKRLLDTHAAVDMSHYANPRTPWMRAEWIIRITLRRLLPTWLTKFMRKIPSESMMSGERPYSEIYADCRWWIERVKASSSD